MTGKRTRQTLQLQTFLPYRLAILAEQVSRTIAQIYADRFDLSRPEWRVLVALVELGEVTAREIGEHSALDKMTVSRAVSALEAKGHLTRCANPADRRHRPMRLTASGRAVYDQIVPLALAREAYLLEALAEDDRAALDRAIEALLSKARELERIG